jgi:hypothetical protein
MKFLVLYMAPINTIDEWMKTDPEIREKEEKRMMNEWNEWMEKNKGLVTETAAAGKTKRVTSAGVEDVRNDIMLYSIVEAPSHEAAAKPFEGHSHLQIPGATIEIMAINPLPDM